MKKVTYCTATICTATIAVAILVFSVFLIPTDTQAQPLRRLSAEFSEWAGGQEQSTAQGTGTNGIAVYRKTVFVPNATNILYVTMSTTGDQHDGAGVLFACRVNGPNPLGPNNRFCNPGAGGAPPPTAPGWIRLQKTPQPGVVTNCDDGNGGSGDCHDNGIYYQWCTHVYPGVNTVTIRMASSNPGDRVFIEKAHWYIDASRMIPGCQQAAP